jgi:hypothetical protein
MAKSDDHPNTASPGETNGQLRREARLAAALRANLVRRKTAIRAAASTKRRAGAGDEPAQ